MDSIELRKFAIEVAQTTTNDGVELMNTANKVLEFLENGSQESDVLCILIFPPKAMFKYVLKMIAGQNPMQVLSDMPERDFNKVAGFVSNLDKSGIPRKQRRMIERKWNDTYGKERHSHKKV